MKLVSNFTASYAGFWFGIQRYRTLGVTYIGLGPVLLSIGNHIQAPTPEWSNPFPPRPHKVLPLFNPMTPVGEYELPLSIYRMSIPEYSAMVLERDGAGA